MESKVTLSITRLVHSLVKTQINSFNQSPGILETTNPHTLQENEIEEADSRFSTCMTLSSSVILS